jgi:CheY-like chemotaxis protein/signal transduction histidine kinase/HPt (histidine-containing phosphotransfer) domain-containing protein
VTTSHPRGLPSSEPARRRRRAAWRAAACALFALSSWLPGAALAQAAVAVDGVLDLSKPGATNALHSLRGDWLFDWQGFTNPSFDKVPLSAVAPVPSEWNAVKADGKTPGPDGHASYTLLVKCPAGEQLALSVPAQRTAMRLFVNGRLVAAQGDPGTTPESARPAIGRRAVLTEPFPCPLRITAHLSNYSHRSGGFIRTPVAGPIDELAPRHQQRLALDTILLGAYLVLSISGFIFFLARRKERVPLYFGLLATALTIYTDMNGDRLLLQLGGPETGWETFLRIEYFAWFASMALFLVVVDQLFPRTLRPGVVRLFTAACALAVLFVALTPGRIYSHLVWYGQIVGVAIGTYVTIAIAQAARQGRKDAGVILAGMAFLVLALSVNLLPGVDADRTGSSITAFSLLAFMLSPAMVLLRRLARALNTEEQRSAEQREKVDLLVRATQAGILDWDYTRNLTRYSLRLLEIMDYPPDTDTANWGPIFERIHAAERDLVRDVYMNQLRDRSVRSGEMKHEPMEYRLLRRDGGAVWVHAEAISLRDRDGRVLRYICSYLDITDHRALAEGLQRQNAALAENARLREDVERMSRHDLKTPLNSIIGVARLLREDAGVPPEHGELLAIAERAGYRMLEMVNLSLDLARMEMGTYAFRPQAVNLVDVLRRVLQDLQGQADAGRVQLRMEPEFAEPVYARAEELLCYSLLANVVKNAIEATPAGGVVRIAIEPGERIRVRVRNPGTVDAQVAPRFFDKYVTAGKIGGIGLGTYSARLMARVQDGELEMETGQAVTVLTLTLRALGSEQLPPPASAGAPASLARRPVSLATALAPRRVLVVDDDEYNRVLLLRYLPSPPFTIETAAHGQAAVEAVARQWPDIIVMDMEMPGMNGLEAVTRIRERERVDGRAPCVIVMMSSNDDAFSIRRGLEAGSNRFLTKPFTRETLLATFQELDARGALLPMQVPLDLQDAPTAPAAEPPPGTAVRVDAQLLREIPAFLESRRRMVEVMSDALAEGDRQQLHAVAHRAAGGLALFGFQWAAWQSRRISARAAEGDAPSLWEDIDRLRQHLQAVEVS